MADRHVALVTGASRGIGRACAHALAEAGFDLGLTARTLTEGSGVDDSDAGQGALVEGSLERTAAEVEKRGGRTVIRAADLLDLDSMRAAVSDTVGEFGRLDVLVLNAVHTGAGSMLRLADISPEVMTTKLAANVVAQLAVVQAALPVMLEQRAGRIISITSYSATHDPPAPVGEGGWGFAYAASKAGFHRLAGFLAVEHGPQGIVAVNVDPGHVMTERMAANAARLGLEGRYAAPRRRRRRRRLLGLPRQTRRASSTVRRWKAFDWCCSATCTPTGADGPSRISRRATWTPTARAPRAG